ncbi:tumor necrosis factor receptor superfamily member 4 [Esox lucius]|uniref:tumor necrosis factor receptor superfamily member 4 n=1 Tax=Esox lucius TaxID=8010 RepID=UPI0014775F40|nr:tumor necrosis factor receptor superfamily member 4 [Esox lucius]
MLKRCSDDLPTICVPCSSGYYMNNYNFQRDCISCQGCSKSELEKVSTCTTKQDDVCKCKTGYRCKDTGPCRECEKMPTTTTTKHTKLPNTTSTAVPRTPNPTTRPVTPSGSTPITNPVPTEDRKWIPMFVTAMCLCLLLICMFAVSKLQSILSWIGSRNNFWSPPQKSLAIQSPEEEEVPMPVQEECGKLELLLDV